MRLYTGLFVCCWYLGMVYSKSVIDPELYNGEFWEQVPPEWLEKLQQTLYDTSYNDIPDYVEAEEASGKLREDHDWPSRRTQPLGQVGGIALDLDGSLVVFHRASRRWDIRSFGPLNKLDPALGPIQENVLFWIDNKTGEITKQTGAGEYYMPHGLTIDKDGNLWLTDVGLHQVIKIPKDPETKGLTLGEKLVPGSDDTHFCKPTDVAVASNGDFFVADGYCNGRIMKFSSDGTLLTKWGHVSRGMVPGIKDFRIPHSLALDESRDLLCVADRENGRIQCYSAGLNGTTAGDFRDRFEPGRGKIFAIEFDPTGERLYAVNGPGIGIIEGFTLDRSGNILESWGPDNTDFPSQPHDVTVSRDGRNVYVGDIGYKAKVWRFSRQNGQAVTVGK